MQKMYMWLSKSMYLCFFLRRETSHRYMERCSLKSDNEDYQNVTFILADKNSRPWYSDKRNHCTRPQATNILNYGLTISSF